MLIEIAVKVAELAVALGAAPIGGAVWEHRIDEAWTIAVNGSDALANVQPLDCMMAHIEPFHTAVWFNGWLAGILSPFDGALAAGAEANEDALIAALDAAIARARVA